MKFIKFFIFFFIVYSCKNENKDKIDDYSNEVVENDSIVFEEYYVFILDKKDENGLNFNQIKSITNYEDRFGNYEIVIDSVYNIDKRHDGLGYVFFSKKKSFNDPYLNISFLMDRGRYYTVPRYQKYSYPLKGKDNGNYSATKLTKKMSY